MADHAKRKPMRWWDWAAYVLLGITVGYWVWWLSIHLLVR